MVLSKPASFSVSVRGAGVRFVDGPLSLDNVGVSTTDNTKVSPLSRISLAYSSDFSKYSTDVTLGGLSKTQSPSPCPSGRLYSPPLDLTLILDTGSSDLVVVRQGRDIDLVNTTDIPVNETFGIGSAAGNVAFADLQIGDFTVQSQGTPAFPASYPPLL